MYSPFTGVDGKPLEFIIQTGKKTAHIIHVYFIGCKLFNVLYVAKINYKLIFVYHGVACSQVHVTFFFLPKI